MYKTRPNDAHTTHSRRPSDPSSPTYPTSPTSPTRTREGLTSSPLDPSKLNHDLAPIPSNPHSTDSHITSPNLREVDAWPNFASESNDSPYVDQGAPLEPASHPTVAETGILSKGLGPGPTSGQLKRVEGGERKDGKGIIKLGSFGGEGLMAKPPAGSLSPKEGEEGRDGSAIAD